MFSAPWKRRAAHLLAFLQCRKRVWVRLCGNLRQVRAEPQGLLVSAVRDEGTAERFRYFLHTRGLSREAFVAGVDGAVAEKTLYALLDGSRRPSRALAVLIERTWGFRAD